MKKTAYLLSVIILLISTIVFAQMEMKIQKIDGDLISIPIDEIDSLYFEETDLTVTDYDGNVYQAIQIGDQIWMAENLRTTHFADGTPIPLVTDNTAWGNLGDNNTDKAYCWFNNNISNAEPYGALYTWAAVMNGANSSSANPSGVQGIAPDGWHIPSDDEWKELEMFLGMSQAQANQTGWRGTDQADQLKEEGTAHWSNGNNGNNSTGFTALGGGGRFPDSGAFAGFTEMGFWWSATENTGTSIYVRCMFFSSGQIWRDDEVKSEGFSVRCIKDLSVAITSKYIKIKSSNITVNISKNKMLTLSYGDAKNATVKIFTPAGRMVKKVVLNGAKEVSLKNLNHGLYLVKFTADGVSETKKLLLK